MNSILRHAILPLLAILCATGAARAADPVVTTGNATSVTDLTATLNGVINAADIPVANKFEYGTTTNYGGVVNTTPPTSTGSVDQVISANLVGLQPATTYHFRAVARDLSNVPYYGADQTFTTSAASTPPTVRSADFINAQSPAYVFVQGWAFAGSSAATLSWEWGTTTSYGNVAAAFPSTLAAGAQDAITGSLIFLQPSTTYHFRLKAVNSEGTTYGQDAAVTTPSGPALTTGNASAITDVSATVTGSVATQNQYAQAFFEFGTTTAYGRSSNALATFVPANQTATVTTTLTGLLPDTTYHYRIVARGPSFGVVTPFFPGPDMTFTTGPAVTPPAITVPMFGDRFTTAAPLEAKVDAGASAATVVFEYGTTTSYGTQVTHSTIVPASTAQTLTLPVTGLTPDTTYHFRVVATNGQGTTTCPDATFTTRPVPTVTTGAVSALTATSAKLNGTYNRQGGLYAVSYEWGLTTAYGGTVNDGAGLNSGGLVLGGVIVGGATIGTGTSLGGGTITIGGGIITVGSGNTLGDGGSGDFTDRPSLSGIAALLPQTTYHFRLRLADSQGNVYTGADQTFTTPTNAGGWRAQHFGSPSSTGQAADDASPAGDGIPNLMKYALRMDPTRAGTLPSPEVRDYGGARHLSLSFQRDPLATDVIYEVQVADSLTGPWTTITTVNGGGSPAGSGFIGETNGLPRIGPPPNTVEVRDPLSVTDAPQRFMRLKVTRLP